ncbi:hypothetical protein GGX14DRAFT_571529 [Mycena pura]|uniref:Uncharacterized protein n=1 Tax=Mycena pura TaxID=153505 RepID=A0AAD6V2N3_9AGAR|nr:hypothetical protein GGX14DRAFT_571529 [Mycena pura]
MSSEEQRCDDGIAPTGLRRPRLAPPILLEDLSRPSGTCSYVVPPWLRFDGFRYLSTRLPASLMSRACASCACLAVSVCCRDASCACCIVRRAPATTVCIRSSHHGPLARMWKPPQSRKVDELCTTVLALWDTPTCKSLGHRDLSTELVAVDDTPTPSSRPMS